MCIRDRVQVADVRLDTPLFHLPDSSSLMDSRDNICLLYTSCPAGTVLLKIPYRFFVRRRPPSSRVLHLIGDKTVDGGRRRCPYRPYPCLLYTSRYASPALAAASYPFVDLPSGDTLRCKLFPADKFYKISLYFDGRIKYNEVND